MPPLVLFQTQTFFSSVKTAFAGREKLAHVSPVHADEGDRAVPAGRSRMAERGREEGREGVPAHLAGREGELPVLGRAEAGDVAVDRHVVGRVGEDGVDRLAVEQARHRRRRPAHRRRSADGGPAARRRPGA